MNLVKFAEILSNSPKLRELRLALKPFDKFDLAFDGASLTGMDSLRIIELVFVDYIGSYSSFLTSLVELSGCGQAIPIPAIPEVYSLYGVFDHI